MIEQRELSCAADQLLQEGRRRTIIEHVTPEIDAGRFPIKRVIGERVIVEADIFTDGHDRAAAVLLWRHEQEESAWREVAMEPLVNDRWRGAFTVSALGRYCYTLVAWTDRFKTWVYDLAKRVDAAQDVRVDLLIGAELVEGALKRAGQDSPHAALLTSYAADLRANAPGAAERALSDELALLMGRYADRSLATHYPRELGVVVEPVLARFSSWYEFFPRSFGSKPGAHGTLRDVMLQLPRIAALGFDVLYLPPVHPIGDAFRKGKNNTVGAGPDDPGSPWAIGSAEGGHKAVHPTLGTVDDVGALVVEARRYGIELAMDIAFQVSPDHPYVSEHAEWFRRRPDGTIQYAENPPKKYQDIYPFDFESSNWTTMWEELKSIFEFWCEQGVRVFRVDNPHTKAFPFWEWCLGEVKRQYPDAIFLSEAFTRPKVMYYLAKSGFSQSYTYFTWRNTASELRRYLTELTTSEVKDYFRPNFWPNTPDILPEGLHYAGRPAFIARLILAGTLAASYGMYAPAYELMENVPLAPGREEYLDSEKYELKDWNLQHPDSLAPVITLLNRIRREHPALQTNVGLRFHPTNNEQLLAYSKTTEDGANPILVVVNLDPHHTQSGIIDLDLEALDIDPQQPYQVHDLLGGAYYLWNGARNYVELNPQVMPAHIFDVRHRVRTERDFDYFM